ncbi:N/A [soil metagenome]
MPRGNPLRRAFNQHQGRRVDKWMHYFEIYHRHFARFRDSEVTIVEFGVNQGGSLQLWREYFGPKARIIGIDIDEQCRQFAEPGIEIMIGDQEDRDFLREVVAAAGSIDLLIEDGGHTMGQQIATFEVVYPAMAEDGCYLVEDLHTSYWPKYGGGYRKPGTFIEYAKDLSDQLNAWYSRDPSFQVDDFTLTTKSMHFYDSIIVFERGTVTKPKARRRGDEVFKLTRRPT